jgi:hypothetical protein
MDELAQESGSVSLAERDTCSVRQRRGSAFRTREVNERVLGRRTGEGAVPGGTSAPPRHAVGGAAGRDEEPSVVRRKGVRGPLAVVHPNGEKSDSAGARQRLLGSAPGPPRGDLRA